MNHRTSLRWRSAVVCVVLAFLSAGILPAVAYAQNTAPTGNGDAHDRAGHHMMMGRRMMGGHMIGNHMLVRMQARGVHGMMGRRTAAPVLVAGSKDAGDMAGGTAAAAQAQADTPASLAAPVAADPDRGQQLALANGCFGCHSLDPGQRMVGPAWYGLADTAASRVPGQSAAEYLYTSIVQPNAFVVPGYRPNVMVQSYGRQLSEDRIAAIVSYLLTLHDED